MNISARTASALLLLATVGCSPEVTHVPIVRPSELPGGSHTQTILLANTALVRLPTGYERVLIAGSRWKFVGVVPGGDVYQPLRGVLTVEGANIHEAYLVIREQTLVGFYLPVEGAYAPLESGIRLAIEGK